MKINAGFMYCYHNQTLYFHNYYIIIIQCYDPVLSKRTGLQESPHIQFKTGNASCVKTLALAANNSIIICSSIVIL